MQGDDVTPGSAVGSLAATGSREKHSDAVFQQKLSTVMFMPFTANVCVCLCVCILQEHCKKVAIKST